MYKIILTKGAPASGKSFWAKKEVASDPEHYLRINNDDLRASFNGSNFSPTHEKIITSTRLFLIREGLKLGKNIIVDNVNSHARHWKDTCKIAQEFGDVEVSEKIFYEDLSTLLERDSKREGSARVGEEVVKKWFKALGGKQFKDYKPKLETFAKRDKCAERFVEPMVQDQSLPKCFICDLDGTLYNISHRNPYDASTCDKDTPHEHVLNLINILYGQGYKCFFFSGREDKFKDLTIKALDRDFGKSYELHMRETGNKENDATLKERMFNTHVKNKFNCKAWFDDRLRVKRFIHQAGLPLVAIGDPDSNF